MRSLKKTGTDFSSANGMDPKAFFDVMYASFCFHSYYTILMTLLRRGLQDVIDLDAQAGGNAYKLV